MTVWFEPLVLLAATVFLGLLVVDTVRFGAPPMPSSPGERRAVLALLRSVVEERGAGCTVLEVGAGWGGLAAAVAEAYPQARVVAAEGAVVPGCWCWLWARMRSLRGGASVRVWLGDVRKAELGPVDVAVIFVGPTLTSALATELLARHPGLRVVSVGFALDGWKKCARVTLTDAWGSEVALWEAPPAGP